jgi:hypothetical protein
VRSCHDKMIEVPEIKVAHKVVNKLIKKSQDKNREYL